MWNYEKRLQYPVKITQTNPKIAQIIISQFGGPDGELAASMRYLSQRYTMPYKEVTGILTDIGTEELAHMEMICAIVYQLTKRRKRSSVLDSALTMSTTHLHSGPRQPAERPGLQPSFSQKEIPSQIFTKIWRRNKKPGQHMTTSYALSRIRKSVTPYVS